MAKFTVFGAGGWIGSALTNRLKVCGHDVQALKRDDWPSGETNLGHVIYAIGVTADFRGRPIETAEAHVAALARVLKQFRYESLLYLSSTRVYRNALETSEAAVLHVKPTDPDDVYNITKLAGESVCLSLPIPTVRVARLSNVIGPGDQSDNFLSAVIREARGGSLTINSAPDSERDYVAISDVVQLSEAIVTRGRHRLYNVAAGRNISHRIIADLVRRQTGVEVKFAPNGPKQSFRPIAIDLIRSEFDAKPLPFESVFPQILQPQADKV